jgi:hypothetical protein
LVQAQAESRTDAHSIVPLADEAGLGAAADGFPEGDEVLSNLPRVVPAPALEGSEVVFEIQEIDLRCGHGDRGHVLGNGVGWTTDGRRGFKLLEGEQLWLLCAVVECPHRPVEGCASKGPRAVHRQPQAPAAAFGVEVGEQSDLNQIVNVSRLPGPPARESLG